MMHENGIPDDPSPGNPSSMPGWNSQWSLEHQQLYYVNASTGERRWHLPTVTTPLQTVQIKPEPPISTPTSTPLQKIQRKAVGAQSLRSNQASPAAVPRNVQAHAGSVRAPLPQATDSYFPPSTAPGQYQASQAAKPFTPPTPAQSQAQPPPSVQSPYQQLDFSGHFASLSLEHSPASAQDLATSPAQFQSPQPTQTTQSSLSSNDVPISRMSNHPNTHNFSSQPLAIHSPPPPTPVQYQSVPTTRSPDQQPPTASNFASQNFQPNAASSPFPAPQAAIQRVPPPPPPRNPVQYQHQPQQGPVENFASPLAVQAQDPNADCSTQQFASPSPVAYQQQQQSNFAPPHPDTQLSAPVPVLGAAYKPLQQQQTSLVRPVSYIQQYAPPPPPGSIPYQQTTSPVQQQYQGPEVLRQTWPAVNQQYPSPIQSQNASPQPISALTQTFVFPPPPPNPQSQVGSHAVESPAQHASPFQTATSPGPTIPTPPSLHHYLTALIPVQGPHQPPLRKNAPVAPPLHRHFSAPEPVIPQQVNALQSGYPQPSGSVLNPYAQQVAHANSFFGPPPRRITTQNIVPQRMPVPQSQLDLQSSQVGYGVPGSNFAQSPQQQPGQPQLQYQPPNQTQYQQPGQFQQPAQFQQRQYQSQPQSHQTHTQPQYQYQTQAQPHQQPPYQPKPSTSSQPLLQPRKTSSSMMGSMGSMGKKVTDFSKTAADKSKRFSVSQPGLKKWGTRAAVSIVAVGALALGVDAISDGGLFDAAGAGGGDFGGGDFGGGDAGGFENGGGGGFGGGELGGGDAGGGYEGGGYEGGDITMDDQTAVDANAAQFAMEQAGQNNAQMLLDPVGTEYEMVTTAANVNALI